MDTDLLISVIIPMFNAENYIVSALDSVLGQSFKNLEIVVVDDWSKDNSVELVESYSRDNSQISIILQDQNQGAGAARNRALKEAKGDYIFFLDSDDFLSDTLALEKLYRKSMETDADLVFFSHNILHPETGEIGEMKSPYERELWHKYSKNETIEKKELLLIPAYPWNKLFKRDLLVKHDIECTETYCHNDFAISIKSILKAEKIAYVPESLVMHRMAPDFNQTTNDKSLRRLDLFKATEDVNQFIKRENIPEELQVNYLQCRWDLFVWATFRLALEHKPRFFQLIQKELNGTPRQIRKQYNQTFSVSQRQKIKNEYDSFFPPILCSLISLFQYRSERKMKPDISLIVPVYNTAPYLDQCLQSIMNQSVSNMEVIVIDDCSTDNSREIIEQFCKKDSRFRLIALEKNSPGGAGFPSNIGIEQAEGEYIGFVDSDDWIEPEMFGSLLNESRKEGADYVFCDFDTFHNQKGQFYSSKDREFRDKPFQMSPVPWRKLYSRDFLYRNNLRFPTGDYFFEDTPFHIMVSLNAMKVSHIDQVLYHHRVFREEQTMYGKGEKFLAFNSHFQTILHFLRNEHYFREYGASFLTFMLDNYHWIWDRLNVPQRQTFFRELHSLLHKIDPFLIESYLQSEIKWNVIRLDAIYSNDFRLYNRIMFKFKSPFGFIPRTVDFFREKGFLNTLKRILK